MWLQPRLHKSHNYHQLALGKLRPGSRQRWIVLAELFKAGVVFSSDFSFQYNQYVFPWTFFFFLNLPLEQWSDETPYLSLIFFICQSGFYLDAITWKRPVTWSISWPKARCLQPTDLTELPNGRRLPYWALQHQLFPLMVSFSAMSDCFLFLKQLE